MNSDDLARRFHEFRPHLTSVAFQIVGSLADAEDVIQTSWLKIAAAETDAITNLAGWFTTITTRTALDSLKARQRRRESVMSSDFGPGHHVASAETEALLADSVSRALLVVLERLSPTERVAFVLHDVFAMPFDEIGTVVDRTPATSKKLASRARAKVRADPATMTPVIAEHTVIVEAFLRAARDGDIPALLDLLAPDVVRVADPALLPPGAAPTVHGAPTVATETRQFATRAGMGAVVLIDGAPGVVIAPSGRMLALMVVTVGPDNRISQISLVADAGLIGKAHLTLPS